MGIDLPWHISIPRPEKLSGHHDGECRNAQPLRRAGHDYKFNALIAKRSLGAIQPHAKTALGTRHFGASHCAWPENLGRRVAFLVKVFSNITTLGSDAHQNCVKAKV